MAKKQESTPKIKDNSRGQIREGHKIGDKVTPMAWQPTKDETTTPPKGGKDKK